MKVNEIFYSLAGEGIRTGQAAIFIRLARCNLKCSFCDTHYDIFTEMTAEEIAAQVNKYPAEWVTLTGGEPTLQDCTRLIYLLKPECEEGNREFDRFHKISIETNGTRYVPWLENLDLVTVSPKDLFFPNARVDKRIWDLPFIEVKFIITRPEDLDAVLDFDKASMLFLQPMNNDPHLTALCVEAIKANPRWRLSTQMHKFINIQ